MARYSRTVLQEVEFPHTLVAVDGKHVSIACPNNSGSLFYNYKHFYSILLFAMVDADNKFLWTDVSSNDDAASDTQAFNDSVRNSYGERTVETRYANVVFVACTA